MALDLADLHLKHPRPRDRRLPLSPRQLVLRDREFVALARSNDELASAVFANLADDGVVEKAVPNPVNDQPFDAIEGVA
jgi:hypothetical protein